MICRYEPQLHSAPSHALQFIIHECVCLCLGVGVCGFFFEGASVCVRLLLRMCACSLYR